MFRRSQLASLLALASISLGGAAPALAQPTPPSPQCSLSGAVALERVRISPPGERPFLIGLDEQPVLVESAPARRVRVRIRGALEFEGTLPSVELPVALGRELTLAGGTLHLRPGTELSGFRVSRSGEVRVDAALSEEVEARDLLVPCAALSLGEPLEAPPEDPHAPAEGSLEARGRHLRLRERPGGGATLSLRLSPEAPLLLAETGRQGAWVRVRHDFLMGSTIEGWVPLRALSRVPPEGFSTMGIPYGMSGLGLCGRGRGMGYHGPATLLAGSSIFASQGGSAHWARAREEIPLRLVRIEPGSGWAQLEDLPGVYSAEPHACDRALDRAWVPLSAIRLPDGVSPP